MEIQKKIHVDEEFVELAAFFGKSPEDFLQDLINEGINKYGEIKEEFLSVDMVEVLA